MSLPTNSLKRTFKLGDTFYFDVIKWQSSARLRSVEQCLIAKGFGYIIYQKNLQS